MTEERATSKGKRDQYAKAVGGFVVAKMSDGEYDYFPVGQPPNVQGEPDKGARIVSRYAYSPVSTPKFREI